MLNVYLTKPCFLECISELIGDYDVVFGMFFHFIKIIVTTAYYHKTARKLISI